MLFCIRIVSTINACQYGITKLNPLQIATCDRNLSEIQLALQLHKPRFAGAPICATLGILVAHEKFARVLCVACRPSLLPGVDNRCGKVSETATSYINGKHNGSMLIVLG